MKTRALGLVMLILAPAAGAMLAGFPEPARYLALGAILALQLGLLSRPVAGFSILLPVAYAAAAITAHATEGVVALVLAVAAAVGVASSRGYQHGLLAVLVAVLMGASEPAAPSGALLAAAAFLAGSSYGYLVAVMVLRDVRIQGRSVHPQTALSYAVLLAVLVVAAWLVGRYAGLPHPWWLALAVAAIGEPAVDRSVRRSMLRLVAALVGTAVLVLLVDGVDSTLLRAALVVVVCFGMLVSARRWRWLPPVLVTPLMVLLACQDVAHPFLYERLGTVAVSCALVFSLAALGQWVLWALRADAGRVTV